MRIMGSVSSTALVHRSGRARRRLGRSFERVASGKRINSGRDDAARLAISSRMKAQSVSLRRTGRNIQEGQELAHVAGSGMSSVTNLLIRMRELAIQAANDTNTVKDRRYIQAEIDQIVDEIDRTARQTEIFGQHPLFDPQQEEIENPPELVNVAFLVDDSGSMANEIQNLRNSIAGFKEKLESKSDLVKFGLAVMGRNHDNLDATELRADIGGADFDADLAALTAGPGGLMDTYASIMEVTGGSSIVGTAEPDPFTYEDGAAKVLVVLTDTRAQEVTLNPPNADQGDASASVSAAGVRADVIASPANAADFSTIANDNDGQVHDIGVNGSGIGGALNAIATELTESTPQKLTDEQAIHSGIDADEEILTKLPSDVRPLTLGVAFGNESGEVLTKDKANELLEDIDDALKTVLRFQSQVGALTNRLDTAQRTQAVAAQSTDQTVSRMEDSDMTLESYELAKARLKSEAANAALARAFTYQRNLSRGLLGLIGGNFSGVG